MRKGEDFRRVGERHWSFTRRIESSEQENEERNETQMCLTGFWNQEAKPSGKQSPSHLGEGEEQQCASSECVNGPNRRKSKDEIDETKPKTGEQGSQGSATGGDKDTGAVKCDDVDTAHLLGQHDCEGGQGGAANTRDGKQLDESGQVVALADDGRLLDQLGVDVVEITSSLKRGVAETKQGLVGLAVETLLHVPTRRFGAEVDADDQRNSREEGRSELETPGKLSDVVHGKIGAETEEDTESCPHLPCHDKTSTNRGRYVFGGVNWYGRSLGAHTNTEEETTDEQLVPVLRESRANDREQTENSREEDGPTSTKVVVQGVRQPAPEESGSNIRSGIDQANKP